MICVVSFLLLNHVLEVAVGIYIAAKRSQDGKADIIPSVRERTCV